MDELNETLKCEIQSLRNKNDCLFRNNKNQKRKIRLKKIIEKQNIFLKKIKLNNVEDNEWEDLDLILKESEMKI